MSDRPNIVVIMSDQHSPKLLGCAGNGLVRTPNLDRLAAQGLSFTNTYCAAPLCAPSRMTFLTSQHPSDIRVWTNGCTLDENVPTVAHLMSLSGYETVLCGRMHFTGDQHRGFERRLVGDVSGAMGSVPPGGKFEGVIPAETTGQTHLTMTATGPGRTAYIAYDDDVTTRARDFLHARKETGESRPLFMVVGYLLPHCPYICPRELFEEYMDRVVLPETPADYLETLHPAMQTWREIRGVERITPDQARRALAAYYGLVTYMDARIGETLAAVNETLDPRNTIVVYLSDHGEMAGEHGMWWKDSFYEASVRVPMIWSAPDRFQEGACVDAVTSLLDVAPTCLSLGGGDPLPGARGRDLSPLLKGATSTHDWHGEVFAESYTRGLRPARMIRSGPWKLNLFHGHERPQVFNVASDPDEWHDLGRGALPAECRALLTRVQEGWSGERVERVVEQRAREREIVRRWRRAVTVEESERWSVPPGANFLDE